MPRVAEATCATCHHIKPRTEMREVPVTRRTSSRYTLSHSRNNNRQSASYGFSRGMVWVCRGCKPPKSDGLMPWKTASVIAIGVVGFMWYGDAQTKRQIASGAGTLVSAAAGTAQAATSSSKSSVKETEGTGASAVRTVTSLLPSMGSEESAAADVDWSRSEIVKATVKALDKGKAVSWHGDGAKGQAVPSSPTITGDRECRNVYATARIKGDESKSPTTKWCRTGEGEWETQ